MKLGNGKVVPYSFFNRSVLGVAYDLIGCCLVRNTDGNIERYMITETEAYDGERDLACHASKGRTKRTEVMFGPAGYAYVYFCYGMHWMLNIVTGPKDYPAAVLIRGVEDIHGPGRVTKKLNITGILNGKKLSSDNGLWIEKFAIKNIQVKRTARVGVDYAGPIWSKKKWRFIYNAKNT